ncbi:MAG: permease [archaeon]
MNFIAPIIFYGIIGLLLFLSYRKNKEKFYDSLKISWKSGKNLLPIFLVVIILLMFTNSFLSKDFMNEYFTLFSGLSGILGAAILGSIVHIPPFIAFPIGGQILQSGVNAGVIAVLINTLIMVHTFTIPIEVKEMGWKFAIVRNGLSFIFAIIIGIIIGVLY